MSSSRSFSSSLSLPMPAVSSSSRPRSSMVLMLTRHKIFKKLQMKLRNIGLSSKGTKFFYLLIVVFLFVFVVSVFLLSSGSSEAESMVSTPTYSDRVDNIVSNQEGDINSGNIGKVRDVEHTRKENTEGVKFNQPTESYNENVQNEAPIPSKMNGRDSRPLTPVERDILNQRKNKIRETFKHAWSGYEKYAFGHDEIKPVTNGTNDSWNGWGVTLVDALDTMILMGLTEEYKRARAFVETLQFKKDHSASFFETVIRYLGGFLGAYSLTEDRMYIQKSIELVDVLIPAFNTKTGLPKHAVNLLTGEIKNPSYTGGNSILAEVGSYQLEFKFLSHITGDSKYFELAQKSMEVIDKAEKDITGLYPLYISPETGKFTTSAVSFGALADSFYEYLLKQYLLSGKKEEMFKRMYVQSLEAMKKHMVMKSQNMKFVGELKSGNKQPEMDHLVCFVPGMVALGSTELNRPEDLELAKELAETCYQLYRDQKSGIGPERIRFNMKESGENYYVTSGGYYLRPETIESIYILFQQTGDPMYREWGWKIYEAIEQYCKTESSYSGLVDVTKIPPEKNDSMQSFFLAETLKYLYLLFEERDLLPQDSYVFNTEAHPLKIYTFENNQPANN